MPLVTPIMTKAMAATSIKEPKRSLDIF